MIPSGAGEISLHSLLLVGLVAPRQRAMLGRTALALPKARSPLAQAVSYLLLMPSAERVVPPRTIPRRYSAHFAAGLHACIIAGDLALRDSMHYYRLIMV